MLYLTNKHLLIRKFESAILCFALNMLKIITF
jgi:hypothetical protein